MTRAFSADDAWLLGDGTHRRLYEVLGAHPNNDGSTTFRVWAPNAAAVSVIGDANDWSVGQAPLEGDPSGVWRGTVAGFDVGATYKFAIEAPSGRVTAKADPFALAAEMPPATASIIAATDHPWGDEAWMRERAARHRFDAPISVYEVHLGSWRYEPGGYPAMARQLADYCVELGFTHVELMPVTEHPFYGSWGYQTTGYFAPTRRYGSPQDFQEMVDILHQAGIGVLVDWVPSHFPVDEHGLGYFDGTHLYEHADPRQGFHPDWKSFVFNYDRPEVQAFLLSSAHFWLDRYHIDGIRVDAVASMLYLDYSRDDGAWIPNRYGGKENLGAVAFLQELNRSVYEAFPDVMMVAEESTAWPGVTNPTDTGGLGFGFKWDMGWMHDTLEYMSADPVHRSWAHDKLTFRSIYQGAEHYMLPLSHDEVVHGKGSLLTKMPGSESDKFANLRVLFGYQWAVPGKKLLFMGGEFGAVREWNHEAELSWGLLQDPRHAGVQSWIRHLNGLYRQSMALSAIDRDPQGFEWVVGDDRNQSVVAFLRHADTERSVLVVLNNTPLHRDNYEIGVPEAGEWQVIADSDQVRFGGSATTSVDSVRTEAGDRHGKEQYLSLGLAPLSILFLEAPVATPFEPASEEE